MQNVLSLVPYKVFPARLGGQKGIALFYKYFSKYNNVTWLTIKDNDPTYANFNILNIISNSRFRYINLLLYFKIKKLVSTLNIQHLIIEHPYFGWLGLLIKRSSGINLIIHSHNIEAERFKSVNKWWWKILWQYEKWVHNHADTTFCKTAEDRMYMINNYGLSENKCHVITYGIDWNIPPASTERESSKATLLSTYSLNNDALLFLFNGTLSYPPNYDAVKVIVGEINKHMLHSGIEYKIFICGKGLHEEENNLENYKNENIIYAGFVEDIDLYFHGVDVFINPVIEGGGIKTKLVEALGSNLNAVSTISGAIGIDQAICNGKLNLVEDHNWKAFAEKMIISKNNQNIIGPDFFSHFYWDNIASKASGLID